MLKLFSYFSKLVCSTRDETNSSKKNEIYGKPCIFPWIDHYTNLTHPGCANPDQDEGGLWCPTEVDENGYFWRGWGYCDENCNYICITKS